MVEYRTTLKEQKMETSNLEEGIYIARVGSTPSDITVRKHEEDNSYSWKAEVNFFKLIVLMIFKRNFRYHMKNILLYSLRHFDSLRCSGAADVLIAERWLEKYEIVKRKWD